MGDWHIIDGDAMDVMATMPARSVHAVVTSPPYYRLRDYGVAGQIGLERTPQAYIQRLVDVFAAVGRVMRDDGTLWINIGDSYSAAKQLMMLPARLAIALQDAGWYIRSEITLCKVSPFPERVQDRPSRATETLYMLTRRPRYYYDTYAVRERGANTGGGGFSRAYAKAQPEHGAMSLERPKPNPLGRNLWNYWEWRPAPYAGEHYATFPPALPARCIQLGTSAHGACAACGAPWQRMVERETSQRNTHYGTDRHKVHRESVSHDLGALPTVIKGWEPTCVHTDAPVVPCTVLDPFVGVGTTVMTALRLGRRGLGIELNPNYAQMGRERIIADSPMFNAPH